MAEAPDPHIVIVVARAENGVIGRDGQLPWKLSSDLKFFRQVTMNKPLIMGRKTFESIGKPLDGRDNIVITRNPEFIAEGVVTAMSVDQAMKLARNRAKQRGADEIAVIGGAQIYALALPLAERIYLTEVHAHPEGDTFFPEIDGAQWRETSRERHLASPENSADFSFVVLERSR
ncbi:MAG: dihydrofolate reductase [Methyloligellaceae bacterium]